MKWCRLFPLVLLEISVVYLISFHLQDARALELTKFSASRSDTLFAPDPHDTLHITAAIPYNGEYGTGEAYVYLSDSMAALANPVVVIEGFDLDNSWDWNELYHHLNQEGMLETLRSEGYDMIVLDFADATDYIQKNSFVALELIQQVQGMISPDATLVVVGASMGGLVGRYALAYMEAHALDHRVRTYISFDTPHHGANIPLGIQYWVEFFSEQSEEAGLMRDRLNRPAARQMLLYHYSMPPDTTGKPDSLRAVLLADFASVGEYPMDPRKVAIANGSGNRLDQGFAPGEQIILYEYDGLFADLTGNVWALPHDTAHIIFEGLISIILLPRQEMAVTVSGTRPYDSAPGGWRMSMADMDSTEAPFGDIIALHPHHCFIPTISALALDTEELYYDIAGDPNLMSRTPFDTVYYPVENQDHASITAENAVWFLDEVRREATAVPRNPDVSLNSVVLYQNYPNPFNPVTTIAFELLKKNRVTVSIYNLEGKLVRTLIDECLFEGFTELKWDGIDRKGNHVRSGVYFYRLKAGSQTITKKMVLIE